MRYASTDSTIHLRRLASATFALHHTVADETRDEDARPYDHQYLLHYVQHVDTREKLLLKHVGRLIVQRSRLVKQRRQRMTELCISSEQELHDGRVSFFFLYLTSFIQTRGNVV